MNERPISPITGEPFKVENYYFQVILLQLHAKEALRSREVNFVFSVLKGTPVPTQAPASSSPASASSSRWGPSTSTPSPTSSSTSWC